MPSSATTAPPVIRAGAGLLISMTVLPGSCPFRYSVPDSLAGGRAEGSGATERLVGLEQAAGHPVEEGRRAVVQPAADRGADAAGGIELSAACRAGASFARAVS